MLRYKFRYLGWGIFVAVGVLYLGFGLFFNRWYEQLALGFVFGAFVAAPGHHPNLIQSAGNLRIALSHYLNRVLRDQATYAEAKSLGVPTDLPKPTAREIEDAKSAQNALCRHLALEQLSTPGEALHKDFLLPDD